GFNEEEINLIFGMIMATKIPQNPTTKLEEILADADLEYLGTSQFEPIAQKLYNELKIRKPEMTLYEWNTMQINFIEKHRYFTDFCIKNNEPVKQKNLLKLKESL
ncbi:MAG: hypothetical protein HYZ42_04375, partial [Bacteroidetes bacterium]|nr:hypothetical protein [Bacteroidota bacterium]